MVKEHHVRVYKSEENLGREDQLAYKIAKVAADPVDVTDEVTDMVINRIIDNASVAIASLNRAPIVAARAQALTHGPSTGGKGAKVFGIEERVSPEWAAWANGVAVRELDYHDTFLAADYSHPGDNIPPILAVGQHVGSSGQDLIRGIATGYEIQVNLVKAICLHKHKIDHVAHLGPSAAAGIGTLLGLDVETIFQSVGQALHTTTATRQSRKGEISTWKAHAPAFAGKMAVESADRAMRGQTSPVPIYEGEDGVIAWMLDGPDASYTVPLPEAGEAKRAIMDTYTKEHSAEYQAQAWIDLARKLHGEHPEVTDPANVESVLIKTSHHTHYVIGSGANDPQKYDPTASRETLDHSIPYIFTVALQDGTWHHVDSYAPERAARPGHRGTLAQGHHGRGPGMDPPLPLPGHRREGLRRLRGDHPQGRHRHHRRHRRRRRPPARRPSVRPGAVRQQVPHARRRPGGRRGDRAVPRRRRPASRSSAAGELDQLNITGGRRRDRPRRGPEGALLMLYSKVTPEQKRIRFRELLASGTIAQFPGAFNPLSARLIEEKGFAGVYISGAVLANDLGLPDIGLTTLTEVATRAGQIARMTDLPAIVDADTGFGEPMNVARTVQELENAGLAGCHIEDQFNPKRCGHLDGKNVVDLDTATKRIRAAADARRDPNFLIMARTDIRATDGLAGRARTVPGPWSRPVRTPSSPRR